MRLPNILVRRLRSGSCLIIPGAKHEMLQERDKIREQLLAAFYAFVPGSEDEVRRKKSRKGTTKPSKPVGLLAQPRRRPASCLSNDQLVQVGSKFYKL